MITPGEIILSWHDAAKHIAIVTLTNERIANALDMTMLNQFKEMVPELKQARVVVLTGAGSDHFCAGANIKEWSAMTPQEFSQNWISNGLAAFTVLTNLPGVVIAAINGTCYGGGLEFALHADVRICTEHARFAFPETGLGIIPGWRGGPNLKQLTNHDLAARMVLLGEVLDADAACTAGIVSEKVPPAKLLDRALELAAQARKCSPAANKYAKQLLAAQDETGALHSQASLACRQTPDCDEGIKSFFEKRTPNF